jgi:hypothetical protein
VFGIWDLEFVCNLVLGIWNLETSASEICPLETISVAAVGLHWVFSGQCSGFIKLVNLNKTYSHLADKLHTKIPTVDQTRCQLEVKADENDEDLIIGVCLPISFFRAD